MGQDRSKWWQLQLRNLLLSVPCIGVALLLIKTLLGVLPDQREDGVAGAYLVMLLGGTTLLGVAIGTAFGHWWPGGLIGCASAILLALVGLLVGFCCLGGVFW